MVENSSVEVFPFAHVGIHFGYIAVPSLKGEDELFRSCTGGDEGGWAWPFGWVWTVKLASADGLCGCSLVFGSGLEWECCADIL